MEGKQKEPKLTYALNELGKMVSIDSVESGLSCNCRCPCPECNELLIAKHGHGVRKPHFAHKGGTDCPGAYMSALHKLAEQIIDEEKAVMAPAYKEMKAQKLSFVNTEVEERNDRNDVQPDVVGETDDELRWLIEIRYTSEVDNKKKEKLIESKLTCLEIDFQKQKLENLKTFLLESTEDRTWINNPNYESLIDLGKKEISQKYPGDSFEIKTKGACSSKCQYELNNGKCIYMVESIPYKGIDFVVCDVLKRQKDKAISPNNNTDEDKSINEASNKPDGNLPMSKILKMISSFLEHVQLENPHLEKSWTNERYYECLLLTKSFEYENDHWIGVAKCDKTSNGILILLKETSEKKILWPYHIVTVSVGNDEIKYEKGNDYFTETDALKAYDDRIKYFQNNAHYSQTDDDNDLPF